MKSREFVDAIRSVVRDAAVQDVVSVLERPPGRRPAPRLVEVSRWYASLSEHDKEFVREAVAMASHQATFGLLAVLDGVRVVEDGPDRGTFALTHVKGAESFLLTDPGGPMLHDLLNEVGWRAVYGGQGVYGDSHPSLELLWTERVKSVRGQPVRPGKVVLKIERVGIPPRKAQPATG